MLETTVHFAAPLVAVRVVDAKDPIEAANDNGSRAEPGNVAALAQAEMARQALERDAIERVLERINEVASQLVEQRQLLLQEVQQVAVELAVAVAAQAIHAKLQAGDFPLESLVQNAIERLKGAGPIVVHLHPDDLALLQRRLSQAPGEHFNRDVRFEIDALMNRGDCRAETGELGVWCKMQGQLEEMRQRLLENLGDAEIERRKTTADDSGLRRFPDRRQTA